jgi:hypothetical protein
MENGEKRLVYRSQKKCLSGETLYLASGLRPVRVVYYSRCEREVAYLTVRKGTKFGRVTGSIRNWNESANSAA